MNSQVDTFVQRSTRWREEIVRLRASPMHVGADQGSLTSATTLDPKSARSR